jgi:hypothetical protein
MKAIKITAALLILVYIFHSCTSADKKVVVANQKEAVAKLPQPFRYHKAVEVKPGLTLDVVSWGRGSESTGAYLILRSDSTHLKYKSISGELDGKIVDVWNMDMDSDGNPELYIQAMGEGEGSHLNMYIYEFADNGSSQKLTFPNLGSSSKKGYKGNDSLYIKDDKLIREFPVVDTDSKTGSESAASRKVLQYGLRNNSFTVNEVKQEEEETKNK